MKDTDLKSVLRLPEGRALVRDLIVESGTFGSSFSTDPLQMAYNEGNRVAGVRLMNMACLVDPSFAGFLIAQSAKPAGSDTDDDSW